MEDNEMSLLELWNLLWDGKWIVLSIVGASLLLAVIYSLVATEWYRAEVLLAPSDERSTQGLTGQLGGLGGLANLAGISVGGHGTAEAIAILQSRELLGSFIVGEDLLPVLFASDWDSERRDWRPESGANGPPDLRDAVKYFQDNVLSVSEETRTGLVTVTVEWVDPELAASWANQLVKRLNQRMRQRALVEAESNVAYLQEQLAGTTLVTLQQSIGRLLESELQKLMLARGNEEFAFRILDPAEVPKQRFRPHRTLIVLAAGILGSIVSLLVILGRRSIRISRAASIRYGQTHPG